MVSIASILFFFVNIWYFPIIFGILVFTSGLLDGVDGAVARRTNKVTLKGGLLDSILDRFSDSFLYMGFMKYYYLGITIIFIPAYIWVFLAILGTFLVSYSRAIAEKYLKNYNCDIGFGARSERLFILSIFSWFLIPIVGLVLLSIISIGTAVYRQIKYFKQLKKLNKKLENN